VVAGGTKDVVFELEIWYNVGEDGKSHEIEEGSFCRGTNTAGKNTSYSSYVASSFVDSESYCR
jgi:hypothetical protein